VDIGDVLTLAVPRADDPLSGVVVSTSTAPNPSAALPSHIQRVHAEQLSEVTVPDHGFDGRKDLESNDAYRAYIDRRLAIWNASAPTKD
jgi:phospholipase C